MKQFVSVNIENQLSLVTAFSTSVSFRTIQYGGGASEWRGAPHHSDAPRQLFQLALFVLYSHNVSLYI